ncbi:hypothetical protein BLOT_008702 [Blomia tropicalis]|nr:hypothetical protein BLOT_008702 [Blomia tropicalis]
MKLTNGPREFNHDGLIPLFGSGYVYKIYNGGTNNHNLPYKMTYGKEAWYVNVQKQNDLWMKRSRTRKFDNAIEYRLTWKISPDVHDQQEICFYVNSAKW